MRRRPPRSTRFPYTTLFRSFRANLFNQRGAVGAVFRAIPYEIKSFDDLGLPPVVSNLCERPRGLILVTGPTGSGKSTTLAAMLDKINRERHEHIVTIEDPIEFLQDRKSTRLNSSHANISYAVFCLKKKILII